MMRNVPVKATGNIDRRLHSETIREDGRNVSNPEPETIGSDPSGSNPGSKLLGSGGFPLIPWIILSIFACSLLLPRFWFRDDSATAGELIRFRVLNDVSGIAYKADSFSKSIQITLATTNIVGGTYELVGGNAVKSFLAEWAGSDKSGLLPLQHTPDVCWPGLGWRAVEIGQPDKIEVVLGGRRVLMECRSFEAPDKSKRELVVWCAFMGGLPLKEISMIASNSARDPSGDDRSRTIAIGQFIDALKSRRAATGHRQFIRISTAILSDWRESFSTIQEFCNSCILRENITLK